MLHGGEGECRVFEIGRSPALMEFDVCGLAITTESSSWLIPARKVFADGIVQFGPSEVERLHAFVKDEASKRHSDVSLNLLVDVIVLSGYDWPTFADLRWLLKDRMLNSDDKEESRRCIEVARRCFTERVVLNEVEWEESITDFGRWLIAVRKWEVALAHLPNLGTYLTYVNEGNAMRRGVAFLRGVCQLRLQDWEAADTSLRAAARLGHRGAFRKLTVRNRSGRFSQFGMTRMIDRALALSS